jgi:glycosyltransferase involved in cell wall biosynthesis
MKIKICHLTSAHFRFDTRIFDKQCRSIAKTGQDITLIVADGKGDEVVSDVKILDVGIFKGRIKRMFKTTGLIYAKALLVDADLYHFHDPELLKVGLKLKRRGKKVIFDSHEDVSRDILVKPYIKPFINKIVSFAYKKFEIYVIKQLDGVIGATPFISKELQKYCKKTINVNNFPIVTPFDFENSWMEKKDEVCYVGSISGSRGIYEMVESIGKVKGRTMLNLLGRFSDKKIEKLVKKLPAFDRVNEYGYVNNQIVKEVICNSFVGLLTVHPIPTFVEGLPIKMFEYMGSGVPIIMSDFPYWRDLLKDCDCCIFVDPYNIKAITEAIEFFVDNPDIAKSMGRNGRRTIEERYNWNSEAKKMLAMYEEVVRA